MGRKWLGYRREAAFGVPPCAWLRESVSARLGNGLDTTCPLASRRHYGRLRVNLKKLSEHTVYVPGVVPGTV